MLIVLLFLLPAIPVCKTPGLDYRVHAMFIYHFTKYIEWPDKRNHDDFQVCFLGETPVFSEFKKVTEGKLIDNRKVSIQSVSPGDKLIRSSDIIYIPDTRKISPDQIKAISESLAELPVLIITEKQGMLQYGSMINLLVLDEKLRFQINKTLIQSRNMKVSSELIRLASQSL
jgi:hypothetical protein